MLALLMDDGLAAAIALGIFLLGYIVGRRP